MSRYKFSPASPRDSVGFPTPKGKRNGHAMTPGIVEIDDFEGLSEAIEAINASIPGIDGKPCLAKQRGRKPKAEG